MAYELMIAFSIVAGASQVPAGQTVATPEQGAPPAAADARYCLRVDPLPGSLMQTVLCKTRDEWALLEVDLDQEWPTEGVKVIEPTGPNS